MHCLTSKTALRWFFLRAHTGLALLVPCRGVSPQPTRNGCPHHVHTNSSAGLAPVAPCFPAKRGGPPVTAPLLALPIPKPCLLPWCRKMSLSLTDCALRDYIKTLGVFCVGALSGQGREVVARDGRDKSARGEREASPRISGGPAKARVPFIHSVWHEANIGSFGKDCGEHLAEG
jgi:hypothetical protein